MWCLEQIANRSSDKAINTHCSTATVVNTTSGTYYTAVKLAIGTYFRTVNTMISTINFCSGTAGQVLSVVSTNEEIPTVLQFADDDLLSGNIVMCSHTYIR